MMTTGSAACSGDTMDANITIESGAVAAHYDNVGEAVARQVERAEQNYGDINIQRIEAVNDDGWVDRDHPR